MAKPKHWDEHVQLEGFLMPFVAKSDLIRVFILVTIGVDGRPCISGNAESPDIHQALRQLGASEAKIADVEQHDMPVNDKGN